LTSCGAGKIGMVNPKLEAHTYDAQGRGLTSTRAYGVDSVSLTY